MIYDFKSFLSYRILIGIFRFHFGGFCDFVQCHNKIIVTLLFVDVVSRHILYGYVINQLYAAYFALNFTTTTVYVF